MNLGEIRQGVADLLSDIEGVRGQPQWPNSPLWGVGTLVVVLPDDPYVTYSEAAGLTNKQDVRMRLVCLPLPSKGAERVQADLDELLSCGTGETRSLRAALTRDLSLGGTACSISVLSASIKTYKVAEVEAVGAEVNLRILARC